MTDTLVHRCVLPALIKPKEKWICKPCGQTWRAIFSTRRNALRWVQVRP